MCGRPQTKPHLRVTHGWLCRVSLLGVAGCHFIVVTVCVVRIVLFPPHGCGIRGLIEGATLCCVALNSVVPTKWRFAGAPVVTGLPAFQTEGGLPAIVTNNSYLSEVMGLDINKVWDLPSVSSHYNGADAGAHRLKT